MSNTLTFKIDKNTYTSKPFDFEAFCLINDRHGTEGENIMRWGARAVEYMFDGTDATPEILASLSVGEMARLSRAAWDMYVDAVKNV